MTEHTPGPWRVREQEKRACTCATEGHVITAGKAGAHLARLCCGWPAADMAANAKLIAAAPELAEALEWALGLTDIQETTSRAEEIVRMNLPSPEPESREWMARYKAARAALKAAGR